MMASPTSPTGPLVTSSQWSPGSSYSSGSSTEFWSDRSTVASSPATTLSSFCGSPSSRRSSDAFPRGRRRASTGVSVLLSSLEEPEEIQEVRAATSSGSLAPSAPIITPTPPSAGQRDEDLAVETGSTQQPETPARALSSNTEPQPANFLPTRPKDRKYSFSRFMMSRPKLERRDATGQAVPDEPQSPSLFNSRRMRKLQGRSAKSAPVSPAFSPSPSSDKLNAFFRSRPSSIVIKGRPLDYTPTQFFLPASLAASDVSSTATSCYLPAMESLTMLYDVASPEAEEPEPEITNLFDSVLPREIRLRIFRMVVDNAICEHERLVGSGQWTFKMAKGSKWVGQCGGLREVLKLSRVSQEWRDLALDGQLWQSVNISKSLGPEHLTIDGLLRLMRFSGPFLTRLNLRGFSKLLSDDLELLTDSCSAPGVNNNLTEINLSGCVQVSTRSLHYLLSQSPYITSLDLRGLSAVTGTTCDTVLRSGVHNLKFLDVSLCPNLSASSLLGLNTTLRHLSASRLTSMDSQTVRKLLEQFFLLEMLDVGYCRNLTDDAFKIPNIEALSPLRLKHLRVSGCTLLTDQACTHLSGHVPSLEQLEMASIGANLRDPGVVKLLEGCRHLRKVDLEDAIHLSDRVLVAMSTLQSQRLYHKPQTSALEHLIVTNVPELTEAALVRLVRSSPKLRVLECSNSPKVSDTFVRSFTGHARRQGLVDAELSIVDCRNIGRQAFRDTALLIRSRRGIRSYEDRHFDYLEPDVSTGNTISECDPRRIVIHSFWTWTQLDNAEAEARTARTAELALEGTGNRQGKTPLSPAILRAARRASTGLRSERSSNGCVIS